VALECVADLEIGDTAGLETCALRGQRADAPLVSCTGKKSFPSANDFRICDGAQPTR